MLIDPKVLEATTTAALRNGWQVATHAIGDRGNALVLDAYAAARKAVPQARDPRLRIEHAQVVRKADVARFAALGIIASMQPSHASDDMRWADARLGPGPGRRGLRLAMVPGRRRSPWRSAATSPSRSSTRSGGSTPAITRQDAKGMPPGGWHPEQKLSLEETLRGFTAGSAWAAFDEGKVGVLRPGLRADLTVVDRDLFRISPLNLLEAKTMMTIVDGQVVYDRGTR